MFICMLFSSVYAHQSIGVDTTAAVDPNKTLGQTYRFAL